MKFTRKLLATSMIAAAGAVPDLRWGSARRPQPTRAAPAPAPSVPGLPFLQQLATNPAAATQLMQGLTSMLGGARLPPPLPPPPRPPLPPGRDRVGHSSAACGSGRCAGRCRPRRCAAAPAAPQPGPVGRDECPNVPFLPVPLPQQLSFPG